MIKRPAIAGLLGLAACAPVPEPLNISQVNHDVCVREADQRSRAAGLPRAGEIDLSIATFNDCLRRLGVAPWWR